MATEKLTRIINAPSATIWAVLSDFSNVQIFHPDVQNVDQLSEVDRGLGAVRRCNFYGGGSAVEKIVAWDDERQLFACTVTELAAPLLDITAGMGVERIDSHHSKVHIEMNYTPKWGIFGKILNVIVLRFVMQSTFKKVLKGLELRLKTGELIGKNGKPAPRLSQTTAT